MMLTLSPNIYGDKLQDIMDTCLSLNATYRYVCKKTYKINQL